MEMEPLEICSISIIFGQHGGKRPLSVLKNVAKWPPFVTSRAITNGDYCQEESGQQIKSAAEEMDDQIKIPRLSYSRACFSALGPLD